MGVYFADRGQSGLTIKIYACTVIKVHKRASQKYMITKSFNYTTGSKKVLNEVVVWLYIYIYDLRLKNTYCNGCKDILKNKQWSAKFVWYGW